MPIIAVTPDIAIDESELVVTFARAGGPGGQNEIKAQESKWLLGP